MSSSESEAFESADEDFETKKSETPDRKSKPAESAKSDETSVDQSRDVRGNANESHVNNNRKTSTKSTDDSKKSKLEGFADPPRMVYCWEEGCDNSKLPTCQSTSNDATKDSDGNVEKSEAKKESENEIEEGWSDFDDWGEDAESEDTNKDDQNNQRNAKKTSDDSFFPVLKGLSTPDGSGKDEKSLFQNLSKLVPNPIPIVSSYDTFPVLDKLTSSSKKTQDPHDVRKVKGETPKSETSPSQSSSQAAATTSSSWGWGGVVSLFSTATEGVTSALSSVIESSIGVPDPEEMARLQKQREEKQKDMTPSESTDETSKEKSSSTEDRVLHGLGHLVSGVTSIGNKVISGGLDTLEGIGKKTMNILQENDPLLLNKRKLLGLDKDKPVLSQVLREAKKKSEETESNLKQMQKHLYKKQLHFETLFDQYHGLVHLEALEMLSKQSTIRLESLMQPLTGKALAEVQETLSEVEEFCDLGDVDNYDTPDDLHPLEELSSKLESSVEDIGIKVEFPEILKCFEDNSNWLSASDPREPKEVYDKSLRCLAETTALVVHKMHKLAELLLIKEHHSTANEADSIVQLTSTFCWHVAGLANAFARKLNTFETSEEISSMITNLFVEQSNSTSCIKNVFQLFIPILQVGAV